MMQTERSAQIVAFPLSGDAAGRIRMRRAMDGLARALEEQRRAVMAWRGALGELQTAATGLQGSLMMHDRAVDRLVRGVASLSDQTQRMTAWSETLPSM